MGGERDPGALPYAQAAGTPEHVMDGDGFERAEHEPPATLDLTNRKGVQPDGKGDQQTVEQICLQLNHP